MTITWVANRLYFLFCEMQHDLFCCCCRVLRYALLGAMRYNGLQHTLINLLYERPCFLSPHCVRCQHRIPFLLFLIFLVVRPLVFILCIPSLFLCSSLDNYCPQTFSDESKAPYCSDILPNSTPSVWRSSNLTACSPERATALYLSLTPLWDRIQFIYLFLVLPSFFFFF